MSRKVIFGTPTLTGHVAKEFCGSMIGACVELARHGIDNGVDFFPAMQFVDVARNALVKRFLENHPDATDLFFIDDDVGNFPAAKVLEFVTRDEDIVAGAYPMKADGIPQYAVHFDPERVNGLHRASWVPGGFMRIRRHVLEALADKAETYSMPQPDGSLLVVFNIFERGPVKGEYVGEDAWFCDKATAAGFTVWLDPAVPFTHRGGKVWSGMLLSELEKALRGEATAVQMVQPKPLVTA